MRPNEAIFVFAGNMRPEQGDAGRKVWAIRLPGRGVQVLADGNVVEDQTITFRVRNTDSTRRIKAFDWIGQESPVVDSDDMIRVEWVDRHVRVATKYHNRTHDPRQLTARNLWIDLHCNRQDAIDPNR